MASNIETDVTKPLAIVHVVSSLHTGGMERVVLQLASSQQRAGNDVRVLALRGGPLAQEVSERGLRSTVASGGRISRMLGTMRSFIRQRPHIVHVHNPTSLLYGVLGKLIGAKIVVTMHGNPETQARIGSATEWRLTSATVAVSQAAADLLHLPLTAKPPIVVHNGVDAPPAQRVTREETRGALRLNGRFVGIIVARIDGRKGHQTLLQALRLCHDRGRNVVHLLVVGDGRERENVERLAATLALGRDAVTFMGSRTDIDTLLAAADFFVLPSDTEGLPLSILEAMAHGLPIVASEVGGIPEVVGNGREALLVPPGDAHALVDAIERLCADPELTRALGTAARHRATTEFSLEATVRRYEGVYRSALTNGGR